MIKRMIEAIKKIVQSLWKIIYPPIRTKLSSGEAEKSQTSVVSLESRPITDLTPADLTTEIIKLRETITAQRKQEEQKINYEKERKESQRRFEMLLVLIGLWLALPQTCAIAQRIVDSLTSLDYFSATAAVFIKLISDACLLSFFIFGLVFLVAFVPFGYIVLKAIVLLSRFFVKLAYRLLNLLNIAKGLQKSLLNQLDVLNKKVQELSTANNETSKD